MDISWAGVTLALFKKKKIIISFKYAVRQLDAYVVHKKILVMLILSSGTAPGCRVNAGRTPCVLAPFLRVQRGLALYLPTARAVSQQQSLTPGPARHGQECSRVPRGRLQFSVNPGVILRKHSRSRGVIFRMRAVVLLGKAVSFTTSRSQEELRSLIVQPTPSFSGQTVN